MLYVTGEHVVCTKAELVSRKLPFVVVWQLSGVNKGVVVSVSAFDDLPTNLIFWFLQKKTHG